MSKFKEVNLNDIAMSPFKLIGNSWMLITSGNTSKYNTMTASWGGFGILWNKPVAFSFVRPQRYTFEFLENNEFFSLSFYSEKYKDALKYCGSVSGRDVDKCTEIGFTPLFDYEAPYFEQATLVFICKKIHGQFIEPESFIDKSIEKNYSKNDYHKMYVGEIVRVIKKI